MAIDTQNTDWHTRVPNQLYQPTEALNLKEKKSTDWQ